MRTWTFLFDAGQAIRLRDAAGQANDGGLVPFQLVAANRR